MKQQRVIALGFFDGVHLGHGQLLSCCRREADRLGARAAALTFDRCPAQALSGQPTELLTTVQERQRLMSALYGIDEMIALPFHRQTQSIPWQEFVADVLLQRYGAVGLVCGYDYRFGKGGEGNAARLQAYCGKRGICCHVIPPYQHDGVTVSSTRLRLLVKAGEMEEAKLLLGHPFTLSGTVIAGRGLGHTIGVPTANFLPEEGQLLPPCGVYASRAITAGGTFLAVSNIGTRPTVMGHRLTIEPWLLDFDGDLYGQQLTLELHRFLRPEEKFPDLAALRRKIMDNALQTRAYFSGGAGE